MDSAIADLPPRIGGDVDSSIVDAVIALHNKVGQVIEFIETRDRPRGKQEDPLTTFCVDLYTLYIIITGKEALSNNGPAHRFVKECAEIVDPSIVVPEKGFQQLLWAATTKRRSSHLQKSPTK
jgi:hypothetical protein